METKHFASVEVKDADKGIVHAVFSTFDVTDHDKDVVEAGAIKDGAPIVVSSYGHTSWDGDLPIGKGVIRTTDTEAVAEMQMFLGTTHGRDAFETIKELSAAGLQQWSYSLQNVKAEYGELNGEQVRFIKSVDVTEVSPVLVGASINTRTLRVKSQCKFSEHATSVVAAVDALTARASEVVALRAEKGKTIADESAGLLQQVCDSLDRLKAVIEPPAPDTPPDVDVAHELARFVLFSAQGALLP